MANGLRESGNTRGFYLQMHNASSSDLVWGGSINTSRKRKASKEFFPVERIVSKRAVRNTVGRVKCN